MANKSLSMQKLRQILLFLKRGYSERAIAKHTGISRPSVHQYAVLFKASGKELQTLIELSDQELKEIAEAGRPAKEEVPDTRHAYFQEQVDYYLSELKREGVTRFRLWEEYLEDYPGGFQYSRFCELLESEMKGRKPVMRFTHNAGEFLQIDFAGAKLSYIDRQSGEVIECPVLVGVLPYSGYSYVQVLPDASLAQVIQALNRMLEYFGGVPLNVLSDNMKQWVSRTCRYEPTFPQMLEQWATHNRIGLLATRPGRPKDKASVENQVLIVYRRIYALLRNETFYSLSDLNRAVLEKLDLHHHKNFQKRTCSRYDLFSQEEKKALQPLPEMPYQLRHYTKGKVYPNYHVVIGEDWHFYSVPHTYVGREVRMVYDADHVEIYYQHTRIAVHTRGYRQHGYTTLTEHMPENHKKIAEQRGWDPQYYLRKAAENGPSTRQLFEKIMESKITIHQAYGPCLGILRLISTYGSQRVEAACRRALYGNRYNYGTVHRILQNKMDLLEDPPAEASPIPPHSNIRGPQTYNNELF